MISAPCPFFIVAIHIAILKSNMETKDHSDRGKTNYCFKNRVSFIGWMHIVCVGVKWFSERPCSCSVCVNVRLKSYSGPSEPLVCFCHSAFLCLLYFGSFPPVTFETSSTYMFTSQLFLQLECCVFFLS